MTYTSAQMAKLIDQTLLRPEASYAAIEEHCRTALRYGFKTVAINNAPIPLAKKILEGSQVLIDAAISFPLGQCTTQVKVFEAIDAIEKGAGEVDYVTNVSAVKSGDWDLVLDEMRRIADACHERGILVKVIFENCYLNDDEKKRLCDTALIARPDFIKTSTGFGTGGATVADVRLMKAQVGQEIAIKAAGGIRTLESALQMLEAGASRIGTSRGVEIVEELKKQGL